MTALEAIQVQRAEEQSRSVRMRGYWERDSWDVPAKRQVRTRLRRPCLAGQCERRVQAHGYCHMHWQRIQRGAL